jgi:ParB family chromosome partitioning protein
MIPWDDIQTAPWNARKTFDKAANEELAASIQQHGIQVPLIVRPLVQDGFKFEIVAGHRRFNAAAALDLAEVPCIVRELSDDQARELGLVDNLQRVDVPAMEEADAFDELLQRLGTIAAVAAKVGKEQAYVAKRLKLCTLTTWSREALREKLITIDHALLLARLAEAEQNAALKWCLDPHAGSKTRVDEVIKKRTESNSEEEEADLREDAAPERTRWKYTWEPQSVVKLKDHIEAESGVPLDRAPWDLDIEGLGGSDVPRCSECDRNTKANTPLFGDLDIGVAVCTDGACFKAKTEAFRSHPDAHERMGPQVPLRVSWKSTSTPPRLEKVDLCKCSPEKLQQREVRGLPRRAEARADLQGRPVARREEEV